MKMTRSLKALIVITALAAGAVGIAGSPSPAEARNRAAHTQAAPPKATQATANSDEDTSQSSEEEVQANTEESTEPATTESKSEPDATSLLGIVLGSGVMVVGVFVFIAFICVSNLALPALVYFMGNVFRGKKPTVG